VAQCQRQEAGQVLGNQPGPEGLRGIAMEPDGSGSGVASANVISQF
jgi:hypothetical protein